MHASKPKIGVIGIGFGAQVYIPGLQSEGWEVAALCSRNREKAAKVAEAAGIPNVHTDPLELIQREDIAAVAIATPPGAHRELAIAALKAGKHVLCEKPFAIDAKEGAAMRDAAEASGRTAMVGHEFRHTPQRAYIKELLAEGYIGKFQLCTIELFLDRYVTPQPRPLTWSAFKADGGGVLGALGSHYIDGLRHWFGEVATVSGHVESLRPDVSRRRIEPDRQGRNGRHVPVLPRVQEWRFRDDGFVVRGDTGARREDRRHGRQRHADRGADRTQSHGGWRRHREPCRLAAARSSKRRKNTPRSRMPATIV